MNTSGFTLLELLVAMAILGTLLAISMPQFVGARAHANDQSIRAYLRHCLLAAEIRRDVLGHLPEGLDGAGCDTPLLGSAAQPEPVSVQPGSSRIVLVAGSTVHSEATSATGRRFRFDGSRFSELP